MTPTPCVNESVDRNQLGATAQRKQLAVPAGTGLVGLGVGYLTGRFVAVPGSTEFWDIAAQPAATALAGFGAITAGYLAFRNGQKSREQERESGLRERYTTAAQQLADDNPAIREAGVYALAALGDDWIWYGELTRQPQLGHSELQVCVNLLCSYLRANSFCVLS